MSVYELFKKKSHLHKLRLYHHVSLPVKFWALAKGIQCELNILFTYQFKINKIFLFIWLLFCTFSISFWPLLHLWTKIVEYLVFICNFFPLSLSIFLRSWQSEQIKNIHIFFQQRLQIRITNPNSNNFQRINNLFFCLSQMKCKRYQKKNAHSHTDLE